MTFALSPAGMHAFRERSNKPAIFPPPGKRDCPFCKKPEFRGQFRNGRCRPCRKAQP